MYGEISAVGDLFADELTVADVLEEVEGARDGTEVEDGGVDEAGG